MWKSIDIHIFAIFSQFSRKNVVCSNYVKLFCHSWASFIALIKQKNTLGDRAGSQLNFFFQKRESLPWNKQKFAIDFYYEFNFTVKLTFMPSLILSPHTHKHTLSLSLIPCVFQVNYRLRKKGLIANGTTFCFNSHQGLMIKTGLFIEIEPNLKFIPQAVVFEVWKTIHTSLLASFPVHFWIFFFSFHLLLFNCWPSLFAFRFADTAMDQWTQHVDLKSPKAEKDKIKKLIDLIAVDLPFHAELTAATDRRLSMISRFFH